MSSGGRNGRLMVALRACLSEHSHRVWVELVLVFINGGLVE